MGEDATPLRPRIGVVVGEGHPMRMGLLRFVLEGEGFRVLAEATSTVELVRALSIHRPEAVVLDDGIGTTAVVVAREMCPNAKVILVWPPHLLPISGDGCVDPSEVLRELGPAIERALGVRTEEPGSAAVHQLSERRPVEDRRATHPSLGSADVLPGPGVARPRTNEHTDEVVIVDREPAPILILPVTRVVEPEPQA